MTVDKNLFRLNYNKNKLIADDNEIKIISDALSLSKKETKIFIKKFYRYFTLPPTVDFILYGISKNKGGKLTPFQLASLMAKELREHPKNLKIPKKNITQGKIRQIKKEEPIIDSSDNDKKRKNSNVYIPPLESKKMKSKNRWNSDDPRDYVENFKKCPHGVPLINKCAICNPEEYKSHWGHD